MPLYEYKCLVCGLVEEEQRPVRLYNESKWCPKCKGAMTVQVSPVPGYVRGTYVDPTTGEKSHLRFKP